MIKFKIGDKVKVISQDWHKPELVGKTGIIVGIYKGFDFCIYFKNWKWGHYPEHCFENTFTEEDYKSMETSCWNLGTKDGDKFVKVSTQLELNFEGEGNGR